MKAFLYLILSIVGFCLVVLCLFYFYRSNTLQMHSPWHSPKMLQVQREFESLCRSIGPTRTKDDYGNKMEKIEDLLEQRLSHQDLRELIVDCDKLPVNEHEWSEFEGILIRRMFWVFLKAGDRDSLVKLFSARFPSRYNFADTESTLVRDGEKIKDPILILDEAYAKCETPEVRQSIAQAIRHAFVGSGIRGNDDADFIKNAFEWYNKEKEELVFSPEYFQNSYSIFKRYYRHPMFVKKGSTSINQPDEEKLTPVKIELPKTVTNSIGMRLALIPAGEFMMGARRGENGNKEDEEPLHRVRITKPFWMGVYEVTREEYKKVMGEYPGSSSPGYNPNAKIQGLNPERLPVDDVNWYDAVEFCNRMSKKEDLPEYYRMSDSTRKPPVCTKILGGSGYRLPTEAEWEYACRAGTTTRYSCGDMINKTQANFKGSSLGRLVEVGSYPPNAFGLFDMHGNVAEWCNDAFDSQYYDDCPLDNPSGPLFYPAKNKNTLPEIPNDRWAVIRGGCYAWEDDWTRSAFRDHCTPGDHSYGFRVARTDSSETKEKTHKP